MVKTSFQLRDVTFQNRVFVASGTFGYGSEITDLIDPNQLGGIMTKSLSMKPRDGNPPRRIVETASGMLNSIGLANIGVHDFIANKLPILRGYTTKIIANIAASSADEYRDVLSLLEKEEGIHGYEINVSCPNVKEGGLSFGTDVAMTRMITETLRPLTEKPLIVKLTPNVTHVSAFAKAVKEAGADAVSLINTVIGMAVNVWTRTPKLSTVTDGLSGPAIKPIALAKVYEVAQSVDIPIIGIGGIASATDALEFLMVGASAIQVGSQTFVDPATATTVVQGLTAHAEKEGVKDLGEYVGSLKADVAVSVLQSWL